MRILLLLCSFLSFGLLVGATSPDESVVLSSGDDTYVVADISAPEDPQGLRDKNFGGLDFLKIWYASQVQAQEQVVSVGLVNFDLGPLKDREIRSAHLQLFATRADLLQPVRLVDVSLADGAWSEAEASFKSLPQLTTPPLASTAVYGANVWYSWDVTPAVVRKARDGNVSYAVGLRALESKGEEQVVFAAREAGRNAPRLVVTLAPAPPSIPVFLVPVGIVIAALAAFGAGIVLGHRRKSLRKPSKAPVAAPSDTTYADDIVDCAACGRKIPSEAELCPRCGTPTRVGREAVAR